MRDRTCAHEKNEIANGGAAEVGGRSAPIDTPSQEYALECDGQNRRAKHEQSGVWEGDECCDFRGGEKKPPATTFGLTKSVDMKADADEDQQNGDLWIERKVER